MRLRYRLHAAQSDLTHLTSERLPVNKRSHCHCHCCAQSYDYPLHDALKSVDAVKRSHPVLVNPLWANSSYLRNELVMALLSTRPSEAKRSDKVSGR